MTETDYARRLAEQRQRHAEYRAAMPRGLDTWLTQRFEGMAGDPVELKPGSERRFRDTIDQLLDEEPDLKARLERATEFAVRFPMSENLRRAAPVEEHFEQGPFHAASRLVGADDSDYSALSRDAAFTLKVRTVFVLIEAAERVRRQGIDPPP